MTENNTIIETAILGSGRMVSRRTKLIIGNVHAFEPLNSRAKKNRGRVGLLIGFAPDLIYPKHSRAVVKYLEPGRLSAVEPEDLAETNEKIWW